MANLSGEGKNLRQSDASQAFEQSGSHHVNIAEAEEEFNVLSRQLTIRSSEGNHSKDTDSTAAVGGDLEKGAPERFDLREYLTSSNDANQKAGIKHKVILPRHFLAFPVTYLSAIECRHRLGRPTGRGCRGV